MMGPVGNRGAGDRTRTGAQRQVGCSFDLRPNQAAAVVHARASRELIREWHAPGSGLSAGEEPAPYCQVIGIR